MHSYIFLEGNRLAVSKSSQELENSQHLQYFDDLYDFFKRETIHWELLKIGLYFSLKQFSQES